MMGWATAAIDEPRTQMVCDPPLFPPSSGPAVEALFRVAERTGLPFQCVDVATQTVIAETEETLPLLPAEIRSRLADVRRPELVEFESGLLFYLVPLPEHEERRFVGVGYVLAHPESRPSDLIFAAVEQDWSQQQLEAWLAQRPTCSRQVAERLLHLAMDCSAAEEREAGLQGEVDKLSQQIDYTFEEISLLHALTQNLQISRGPLELARLCVSRMQTLIGAAGCAIWLGDQFGNSEFVLEGTLPFDQRGFSRLLTRFEAHDSSRPLVRNRLLGTRDVAEFADLDSFVIVPIAEGAHRRGWIVSCNLGDGREFGTVEASLMNSVATILATHIRNIELYCEHDELLLAFVRSLVSTLEARDPYTRGHSERVALVARRLGQEMGLSEDELDDIYLAGLLHDIGKIGIDDRILRKPGQLTDEEFRKIQEHPLIGYSILAQLKNLSRVLPGVRNHHETYSGKGYPDGLKGEAIPLMARILAVADSYDAMSSSRPYRTGMASERLEEIFRRGSGEQWDERVVAAYFAARDDIRAICENFTPSNCNLLRNKTRKWKLA